MSTKTDTAPATFIDEGAIISALIGGAALPRSVALAALARGIAQAAGRLTVPGAP